MSVTTEIKCFSGLSLSDDMKSIEEKRKLTKQERKLSGN